MSKEIQYALFAGGGYYPMGGVLDLKGLGSIDFLMKLYADNSQRWADEMNSYSSKWGQIVDRDTLKIILETSGDQWNPPNEFTE